MCSMLKSSKGVFGLAYLYGLIANCNKEKLRRPFKCLDRDYAEVYQLT